jgi:transposase InsO family protein
MSVAEQRYQAVLAVIAEGRTVTEVAAQWKVSRQTLHAWLARYELEGLEGLADRSHRPGSCPHQMPAALEARVLEMRRAHPFWGPRRIVVELRRSGSEPVPSESAVYRCLVRAQVIAPQRRKARREDYKRWERGRPNELWQMDVVGGFLLADGSQAKALTGIDDHSRFCVSAQLMPRERTQRVCDGLALALRSFGVPEQILTDNGRVFTGRFHQPPVEVLFDRICRENGIEHLLTQPRSPTTTGKVQRFHRTLRVEFDTTRVFKDLRRAQIELDEWVAYYNTDRPHQAIDDLPPATRYQAVPEQREPRVVVLTERVDKPGEQWVTRRVAANGIVCVDWQQVSVGKHHGGQACDVLVTDTLLQFWVGNELLKTAARIRSGDIRKKHAQGSRPTA